MTLQSTHIRIPRQRGLHSIQQRGQGSPAARELSSWRLCLDVGATATFERADEETVLVLQQGRVQLRFDGREVTASRVGVFQQPASALFLPPGHRVEVEALDNAEAVLISASSEPRADARAVFLPASKVEVVERGVDGYRRVIHNLFVDDPHCRRLLVGETFNPPGMWSSYPPHKHDGKDGEPALEELYYYRTDPEGGFGQQLLYERDGESVAHTVRDGDAVLIPFGYHPVCAPPGYHLCYLWALAGEQRKLALYEDPDHRWIHQAAVTP